MKSMMLRWQLLLRQPRRLQRQQEQRPLFSWQVQQQQKHMQQNSLQPGQPHLLASEIIQHHSPVIPSMLQRQLRLRRLQQQQQRRQQQVLQIQQKRQQQRQQRMQQQRQRELRTQQNPYQQQQKPQQQQQQPQQQQKTQHRQLQHRQLQQRQLQQQHLQQQHPEQQHPDQQHPEQQRPQGQHPQQQQLLLQLSLLAGARLTPVRTRRLVQMLQHLTQQQQEQRRPKLISRGLEQQYPYAVYQKKLWGVCCFSTKSHALAAAARIRRELEMLEKQALAISFPAAVVTDAQMDLLQLTAAAVASSMSGMAAASNERIASNTANSAVSLRRMEQLQWWVKHLDPAAINIVHRVACIALSPDSPARDVDAVAATARGNQTDISSANAETNPGATELSAEAAAVASTSAGKNESYALSSRSTTAAATDVVSRKPASVKDISREGIGVAADVRTAGEAAAVSVLLPGLLLLLRRVGEVAVVAASERETLRALRLVILLQQHLRRRTLWGNMTDEEIASTAEALEQLGCTDTWIADAAAYALLRDSRYASMPLTSLIKASKVLQQHKLQQQQQERQAQLIDRLRAAKQVQRFLFQQRHQALETGQLVRAVLAAGTLGPLSHVAANQVILACRRLATQTLQQQQDALLLMVQEQRQQPKQKKNAVISSIQQREHTRGRELQRYQEERNVLERNLLPDEELLQLPAAFAAAGVTDEYLFLWAAEQLLLRLGGPSLQQMQRLQQRRQHMQGQQHLKVDKQHKQQQMSLHGYRFCRALKETDGELAETVLWGLALLQHVGPPGMQQPALPLFCRQKTFGTTVACASIDEQQLQYNQREALQELQGHCLCILLLEVSLKRTEKQRLFRLLHATTFFLQQYLSPRKQQAQQLLLPSGNTMELETAIAHGLCRLYAHLQQHMHLSNTSSSRARNAAAALLRGISPHEAEEEEQQMQGCVDAGWYAGETPKAAKGGFAEIEKHTGPMEAFQCGSPTHRAVSASLDSLFTTRIREDSGNAGASLDCTLPFAAASRVQVLLCESMQGHEQLVMTAAQSMLRSALDGRAIHSDFSSVYMRRKHSSLFDASVQDVAGAHLLADLQTGSRTDGRSVDHSISEDVQMLVNISTNFSLLPSVDLLVPSIGRRLDLPPATFDTAGAATSGRNCSRARCRTIPARIRPGIRFNASPLDEGTTKSASTASASTDSRTATIMLNQRQSFQQQHNTPQLLGLLCELLPLVTRVCFRGESTGSYFAPATYWPSSHEAPEPSQLSAKANVNATATACVRFLLNFIPALQSIFHVLRAQQCLLRTINTPTNFAGAVTSSAARAGAAGDIVCTLKTTTFNPCEVSTVNRVNSKRVATIAAEALGLVASASDMSTEALEGNVFCSAVPRAEPTADNEASSRLHVSAIVATTLSSCSLLLLQLLLLIPDPRMTTETTAYSLRGLLACVHRTPQELLPLVLSAACYLPPVYFLRHGNESSNSDSDYENSGHVNKPCFEGEHCHSRSKNKFESNVVRRHLDIYKLSRQSNEHRICVVLDGKTYRSSPGDTQSRAARPSAAAALAAPVALLVERLCTGAGDTTGSASHGSGDTCGHDGQPTASPRLVPERESCEKDALAAQRPRHAAAAAVDVSACSVKRHRVSLLRVNAAGPCLAAVAWLQQQQHLVESPLIQQQLQKVTSYHSDLEEEARNLLPLLPSRDLRLLRAQLLKAPSAFGRAVLSYVDRMTPYG